MMDDLYSRRHVLKMGGAAFLGLCAGSLFIPTRGIAAEEAGLNSLGDMYAFPSWWPQGRRLLENPPEKLVDAEGRLRLGFFTRPVRHANFADAAIFGEPEDRARSLMQIKEHIGFGLVHPDIYFSMIIMDFQSMAASGMYSFDRVGGKFFEHRAAAMDREQYRLADTTWNEDSFIAVGGYNLKFEHRLDDGHHRIIIDMAETKSAPAVSADFTLTEDLSKFQSQILCIPMKPKNFMYSHKSHMPAEGWIKVAGREYRLDPKRDKSGMDEHRGYYVMNTSYCWSTVVAEDADGRMLGMNVTENANFFDAAVWNENCVWVDGKLSHIGAVHFEFDVKEPSKPWKIKELNGRVDLEFTPDAIKKESFNLLVASVDYYQQCGLFNGYIVDDAGGRHEIGEFYGVAEKFDSRFNFGK